VALALFRRKFIRVLGENLFEPSLGWASPASGSAFAPKLWRTQSNESSPQAHPPRRIALPKLLNSLDSLDFLELP
jgi:hypothetical protein